MSEADIIAGAGGGAMGAAALLLCDFPFCSRPPRVGGEVPGRTDRWRRRRGRRHAAAPEESCLARGPCLPNPSRGQHIAFPTPGRVPIGRLYGSAPPQPNKQKGANVYGRCIARRSALSARPRGAPRLLQPPQPRLLPPPAFQLAAASSPSILCKQQRLVRQPRRHAAPRLGPHHRLCVGLDEAERCELQSGRRGAVRVCSR